MFIDDFIWLPDIVEKLAWKHHLTQDEVEEVFFNTPQFRFVEKGYRAGEDVYAALGQSDGGRYLIVSFYSQTKAYGINRERTRHGRKRTETI